MHPSPVSMAFFDAGESSEPITRRTYTLKEEPLISFQVE